MSRKEKIILGITGSFGSGKTSVVKAFSRLGACVIDADRIYRRIIKPNSLAYKRIVSVFGRKILAKDRQIDRKELAKMVFGRKEALKKLCAITHPVIISRIKSELSNLEKLKRCRIIAVDAPLLIEADLIALVDKLVVVKIRQKSQIERMKRYRRLSRPEAVKRIRAQMPLREKVKLADFIIDNNGTLTQTKEQVQGIWQIINKERD